MNPDGTQDSFGVAFHGDDNGNIWQDGVPIFTSDIEGMREVTLGKLVKKEGVKITDLLKISGCLRLRILVDSIDARDCLEDAIDINHSHDVEIMVNELYAANTYCSTIKGGSTNIRLMVAAQYGHGSETDYDLGNFSDQSNARTKGISLHINTADGSPVKIRLLTADAPTLENQDNITYFKPQTYKVVALNQGWFYPVFNFFKDFLKHFGIKI